MTTAVEAQAAEGREGRGEPPRIIARLLGSAVLGLAARVALALPFVVSGIVKLGDFSSATAEVSGLGLAPAAPVAAAVIATQLVGSGLFLTPRWCWLGAGLLAGFTALATLIAHPFWAVSGPEAARQTATFFEHAAIVGGLAAAAALAHRERKG